MSRRRNATNQAMAKLGLNRYKLGSKKKNRENDFVYDGMYAKKEKTVNEN